MDFTPSKEQTAAQRLAARIPEAAWRHDEQLAYEAQALTPARWAPEAGRRGVHAGRHPHGGTGAGLDHPVHRPFLRGRRLDAYLGRGREVLEDSGLLSAADGHGERVS
ncbi:hypothetical protein [Streptomyces sindenensis]|uniref:hypothetical protein n=1 Tax=Streptomyces sindenensis TaxID=67363 RepID=UPI0019BF2D29|nr:hypothetical protein GCM10010231_08060 [Streptomyces sindenensis]